MSTCVHCNYREATRPRGLCRRCYETPAVRELYPVPDKYAAREPVVAYTGEPTEPTDAAPGTADKVAVMEARAACGQSLFHPLDGPVDTRRTTPAAAAWLAGQLFSEVAWWLPHARQTRRAAGR